MENTKILKQKKWRDIKVLCINSYNLIEIRQGGRFIAIEKENLPELIELLKSELEVNNG